MSQQRSSRKQLAELRRQSQLLRGLAGLGVEQVKGLATVASGVVDVRHEVALVGTEVSGVRSEVAGVRDDIRTLGALFDWSLDEVLQEVRVQTAKFDDINAVLTNPLGTQANELWERAQFARARGWIEESVEAYTQTLEKNPFLYPAHLQLAFIHVNEQGNLEAATGAFAKAARYAEPDDPDTAALAYFHLQKVERELGRYGPAWTHAVRACDIDPTVGAVWWDRATLAVLADRPDDVLPSLERAISLDPLYWHRASEHDWGTSRATVESHLESLQEQAGTAAEVCRSIEVDMAVVQRPLGEANGTSNKQRASSWHALRHRQGVLEKVKEGTDSPEYAVRFAAYQATLALRTSIVPTAEAVEQVLIDEKTRPRLGGFTMGDEGDLAIAEGKMRPWPTWKPVAVSFGVVAIVAFLWSQGMLNVAAAVAGMSLILGVVAYLTKRNNVAAAKKRYVELTEKRTRSDEDRAWFCELADRGIASARRLSMQA